MHMLMKKELQHDRHCGEARHSKDISVHESSTWKQQARLRKKATLRQGQGRGPVSGHCWQSPGWQTPPQRWLPQASSLPQGLPQRKSPTAHGTTAVSAPQAQVRSAASPQGGQGPARLVRYSHGLYHCIDMRWWL